MELWTQDGAINGNERVPTRRIRRSELESQFSTVRQQSPDVVVHDHGVWLPWNHTVAQVTRRHLISRVVSPRGMLEPWAMSYRSWKKKVAWHTYQRADLESACLLHATAQSEASHLRAYGLTAPIVVAPNGVDVSTEPLAPHEDGRAPKTALFLSRLHPKKGLLDLVEAWRRLRPPHWRLRIVGPDEGGHQREVLAAVVAAGLRDVIDFKDQVAGDAKWRHYRESDLFVLPSYSENFGIVVAEALRAGLPVITTQATPWSELASDGCGWWIATGVDSLEVALRQALTLTSEERRAMGQAGRRLVERRYTWPAVAEIMMENYTRYGRRQSR